MDDESHRVQPNIPIWAYSAVRDWSNATQNSKWSKGLVLYEAILLAHGEYEDSFSGIEAEIDSTFAEEVGTPSLESINKIKFSDIGEARSNLAANVDAGDPFDTADSVSYHLPVSLYEQIGSQEWHKVIPHSILHVAAAPWSSRMERANVKRELIQFARGEHIESPHSFTEAVMEEDTSQWDVSAILVDLKYENKWENPNITFDELAAVAENIPQTGKKRIPALQNAVNNAEGIVTRQDIIDFVMADSGEGLGITTKVTAKKYADAIDFGESGGVTVDFVEGLLSERAEHLRNGTDDTAITSLPDHELVGMAKEVYSIDGTYPSLETAEEALESIRSMKISIGSKARAEQRTRFITLVTDRVEWLEVAE